MADKPVQVPLPAGRPVLVDGKMKPVLTDLERAQFDKLGIDNPNEAQVRHMQQAAKAFMEKDARAVASERPVDPSKPPVTLDEEQVRSADDLTPEQQAELKATLEDMGRLKHQFQARPLPQIPGLADAVMAADAPATEPAPAENSVIPAEPELHTGVKPELKTCPRCKWDLSKEDPIEVGRDDRLAYFASLYGARFKKVYSHFGGDLRFVFRTIEAEENNMLHEQVRRDMLAQPDAPLAAYYARLFEYMLALKLERVEFSDGRVLTIPADRFLKGRPAEDGATPLQGLLSYVRSHVIKHESLSRIAARYLEHFNRLVEKLESDADTGFTTEISGRS